MGGEGAPVGYHHGNLREALVDAALTLIAEKGASALTLREVARRSGVSHAAPYRHFADKNALVAAVAEEGFRLQQEAIAEVVADAEDPVDALRRSGRAYLRFALAHPAHYRVMFGRKVEHEANEALAQTARGAFAQLRLLVESGIAAGALVEEEPEAIARVLWAQVHGLTMLILDGLLAEDVDIDLGTRLLMNGLLR